MKRIITPLVIYLLKILFPPHFFLVESPHLPVYTLKHMFHQEEPKIIIDFFGKMF